MHTDPYTDTPTKIRVHDEGDHWAIDGADDAGNYTEAIWTHWDDVEFATRDDALAHAADYAAEHGYAGLPVVVIEP